MAFIAHDTDYWLRQSHMPVTYPAIYLEIAAEHGISAERLLAEAKLRPDLLAQTTGRISNQEYVQLVSALLRLVGDIGLGLIAGARQPLTAHGSLGYALMSAATIQEAIAILQRFWHLRGRGIRLDYYQQDQWLIFEFMPQMPLSAIIQRVLFEAVISGVYHGLRFLVADVPLQAELWFSVPPPDYVSSLHDLALPVLRYGMPVNQLRVNVAIAEQKLRMANPEALALAIAQCEREYALLEEHHQAIALMVRSLLKASEGRYATPQQLADKLHLSERSLRRHLQQQDTSYQQLLDEARQRDALLLLEKYHLDIQKIAAMLGFTNPANFTRAFKQWTGQTPSQYRLLRQSKPDTSI